MLLYIHTRRTGEKEMTTQEILDQLKQLHPDVQFVVTDGKIYSYSFEGLFEADKNGMTGSFMPVDITAELFPGIFRS
jgi:3-deoxy-D-manno-octulosonic-acid transferase